MNQSRFVLFAVGLAVVYFATGGGTVNAQSIDVPNRENALRLLGYGLADESGFAGSGVGIGYGIGGLLDVGFDFGLLYGDIEDTAAEEARFTFLLRGLIARQAAGSPATLFLGFNYHYSIVQSDYLTEQLEDTDLLRDGRGYSVIGSMWRDFALSSALAIRTGLSGIFTMERYTTYLAGTVDDEEASPEAAGYPSEERERTFTYTASMGPVIRPHRDRYAISAIAAVGYDHNAALTGNVELGVTFVRQE